MSEGMSIKSDLSESWLEALDLDGLEEELREEDSAFNFSDYEKYANPANASGYFDEDETEIGSSLGSSRFKDDDEDEQVESEFDDEVITDDYFLRFSHLNKQLNLKKSRGRILSLIIRRLKFTEKSLMNGEKSILQLVVEQTVMHSWLMDIS